MSNNVTEIITTLEKNHGYLDDNLCLSIFLNNNLYEPAFLLMKLLKRHEKAIEIAVNYLKDGDTTMNYIEQNYEKIKSLPQTQKIYEMAPNRFEAFLNNLFENEEALAVTLAKSLYSSNINITVTRRQFKNPEVFLFILDYNLRNTDQDSCINLVKENMDTVKLLGSRITDMMSFNNSSFTEAKLLISELINSNEDHVNFILLITNNDFEKAYKLIKKFPENRNIWKLLLKKICHDASCNDHEFLLQKILDDILTLKVNVTQKDVIDIVCNDKSFVTLGVIRPWLMKILEIKQKEIENFKKRTEINNEADFILSDDEEEFGGDEGVLIDCIGCSQVIDLSQSGAVYLNGSSMHSYCYEDEEYSSMNTSVVTSTPMFKSKPSVPMRIDTKETHKSASVLSSNVLDKLGTLKNVLPSSFKDSIPSNSSKNPFEEVDDPNLTSVQLPESTNPFGEPETNETLEETNPFKEEVPPSTNPFGDVSSEEDLRDRGVRNPNENNY